jgi:hypothetical protein
MFSTSNASSRKNELGYSPAIQYETLFGAPPPLFKQIARMTTNPGKDDRIGG